MRANKITGGDKGIEIVFSNAELLRISSVMFVQRCQMRMHDVISISFRTGKEKEKKGSSLLRRYVGWFTWLPKYSWTPKPPYPSSTYKELIMVQYLQDESHLSQLVVMKLNNLCMHTTRRCQCHWTIPSPVRGILCNEVLWLAFCDREMKVAHSEVGAWGGAAERVQTRKAPSFSKMHLSHVPYCKMTSSSSSRRFSTG